MSEQQFAALVVDDELAIRRLTSSALARFHFSCDQARDGTEASKLVCRRRYDVIITDLRMPKQNGHAFAVEVLALGPQRPLIVVLTSVLEPRLTDDLLARGVDVVEYKPVDFESFSAKVRTLCEERSQRLRPPPLSVPPEDAVVCGNAREFPPRIPLGELEQRLGTQAFALPLSPAAIEVISLLEQEQPDADVVTKCLGRDPGLSIELLRLANSPIHNPSGHRVDDLHTAILRLGHRKIAELALASSTLQILATAKYPWIDAALAWRRLQATGLAIEQLHTEAKLGGDDEGLFLSAMLVPLSRVFAGLIFPDAYRAMLQRCKQTGESLASLERQSFEFSPETALANYLASAGLPPRFFKPLKYATAPAAEFVHLTEPLRSKAERLRYACSLGEFTAGQWAPWDELDFSSPAGQRRVQIENISELIARFRAQLDGALPQQTAATAKAKAEFPSARQSKRGSLRYFKLTVERCDFLTAWLVSLGLEVVAVTREAAQSPEPVLVNCLDVSSERLAQFLDECEPSGRRVLVGNSSDYPANSPRGVYLSMPCSFHNLLNSLPFA